MTDESQADSTQITNVPVRLHAFEQPAQFANHISVNGTGNLVQLDFSQVLRPSVGSEHELQELIAQGISGYVISRLLIPEEVFRSFILGMSEQMSESEDEQS